MTLRDKKLFLLDMDGTLYLGDRLFDATLPFLSWLRESGRCYRYLTNNSSKSVSAYVEKLARLGIDAAEDEFFTSVDALILRLREFYADRAAPLLYAVGTASFCDQLRTAGFAVTDRPEEGVTTLVCGFDTELTFRKLEDACRLLGRPIDYFAANPDWVCPTEFGYVPDCGSVCEMLFRATGRRPEFIGKPQPLMVESVMRHMGVTADQTVLLGDRLYTDIACGVNAGVDTVLLLSGETDRAMLEKSEWHPTYVYESVGSLLYDLTEKRSLS